MQLRSSKELREMFLSYFEEKGSRRYASFPLVPDDPTLLFTVAGMVPFKPYFLGLKTPEVTRAATAQKCIRTNDIDNVGRTARHHTFFEMLGNFSFGDYFKREAIPWAWTFLTERVGLDPNRMYATIYLDDDEAHDFWCGLIGLPEERIVRLGDEDNFWAAGPTGPCGPCSEIIYDQGPSFSCGKPDCKVGCDCDRYLEIWNLVFMQFSRGESGNLTPLPKKNIDTGMGLERLCSVVQQVPSNFETDLFRPVIDAACNIAGIRYGASQKGDLASRVISDHLRASAFMIADGVLPANEGPGYVLRRIIRRSIRYGRLAGIDRPFLAELLPCVEEIMGGQYSELLEYRSTVEQVISLEEQRFGRTLAQGTDLLEDEIKNIAEGSKKLSGEVAFVLYDTYGFPLELTEEICGEAGVSIGREEFDAAMKRQRERARASSKQTGAVIAKNVYTELADREGATQFDGYDATEGDAVVVAIIDGDKTTDRASEGSEVGVVLSRTPFYAERGGQVGDKGTLSAPSVLFQVGDTVYPNGDLILHKGKLEKGDMAVGMKVRASVDTERRDDIRRHHTATHLLHEALLRVLGKHVRQAGSLVTPTFLRFDYNHFAPLSQEELHEIERVIYLQVLANLPVDTHVTNYAEAKKLGAKALFEEKYGDVVRVLRIPGFSTELCGGTHVRATGEIGLVKIVRDEGIGSGMRRINAVAGRIALTVFQEGFRTMRQLSNILGGDVDSLAARTEELLDEKKILERKNHDLALRAMLSGVGQRIRNAVTVEGLSLIAEICDGVPKDLLRQLGDGIKQADPNAVILLACVENDQVALLGMATDSAIQKGVHAGNLVKEVASLMGGSGGGKPAIGQAGSKNPDGLREAMSAARGILEKQIKR